MQLLVTNSPFSEEQLKHLNALLPTLSEQQIYWLSGYLAFASTGQATRTAIAPQAALTTQAAIPKEATILFGSQTGNAQRLAGRLADKLKADGFEVTLSAMNKYKTNLLKDTRYLFILVSTHGEGDPPDNAKSFYEFLNSKRAPKLDGLSFSVLALGDTSYEFFCKTGQDFEAKLLELGAAKLVDRVDCDVDFEEAASGWIQAVAGRLQESLSKASGLAASALQQDPADLPLATSSAYSRNNPFQAEILESINLSGRGSNRVTTHLELSLAGSNLSYEPGDALGVIPHNDEQLVEQLLKALEWDPNVIVTLKEGEVLSIGSALTEWLEITSLSKILLEKLVPYSEHPGLKQLVNGDAAQLRAYIKGRDLLDVINDYGPWTLKPEDAIRVLRKIPARLYSIASSLKAHPEEVHLTIRKVEYTAHGRQRNGVCSSYVADRVQIGDKISVFVQENPNFKLPQDDHAPIIMVGPGTGVAPFRAFIEEREERGAKGKSWLFFGDRNYVTDFLYQTDWQRMLAEGALTKLEVAFSRDTEEKIYVQHRLKEHAAELYSWLEQGAYIYVCGDEKHMAHDVHTAFIDIVKEQRQVSEQDAIAYIAQLQDQGRYQRDVY